jgi:5-methylcytosine-specific restriction endonuclease McrA
MNQMNINNYQLHCEIPYNEQLTKNEWKVKRQKIIKRDKGICQQCLNFCTYDYLPNYLNPDKSGITKIILTEKKRWQKVRIPIFNDTIEFEETIFDFEQVQNPLFAHVHHKYYVLNSMAWEYPDEALILLCNKCHFKFHSENIIPIYTDHKLKDSIKFTPCQRCNGAGIFPEFSHIQNGICFRCNGNRFEEFI